MEQLVEFIVLYIVLAIAALGIAKATRGPFRSFSIWVFGNLAFWAGIGSMVYLAATNSPNGTPI